LFQEKSFSPLEVIYKFKYICEDIKVIPKPISHRQSGTLDIDKTKPWDLFDGATQGNPNLCVA
jgi:hypothetical protein